MQRVRAETPKGRMERVLKGMADLSRRLQGQSPLAIGRVAEEGSADP